MNDPLYSPDELLAAPCAIIRHLMEDIQQRGRADRRAMFLHGLSQNELMRYAKITGKQDRGQQDTGGPVMGAPDPDDEYGPAPDIFAASIRDVEDWLHTIWMGEEACCDDPAVPVLPFRDWLVYISEDSFHRWHLHSRFYLGETEPKLPI